MRDLNAGKGGGREAPCHVSLLIPLDSQSHFAKRRMSNGPFAVKDSIDRISHKGGYHDKPRASTQSGPFAHGTCTRAKNSEKSGKEHQNASCCEPCVAGVDSTGNCAAMMLDLEPGLIVKKEETLRAAHGSNHVGHSTYKTKYMELERSFEAVSGYVRRSLSVTLILLDYERNIEQGCISTRFNQTAHSHNGDFSFPTSSFLVFFNALETPNLCALVSERL
ncbi:uncharacterized protein CLUP02_06773 [Colletotrichum lupini]|uniref:Uncharacterized protein n=1 Tax=Colletotrichum lupini TaxID=145971 RepID=A0A9Q8SRK3_9PEZI|nr:uncharacterized protein CLUP02_06773 [Colletotrichum lupini]UQC81287.1 hypothetical protein CLUP02_06773 [Colletotrichum lupini]